jgi:hypothetical protein
LYDERCQEKTIKGNKMNVLFFSSINYKLRTNQDLMKNFDNKQTEIKFWIVLDLA